ncbi:hypothetical protein P3S68_032299 [Capsicum galapagoense]
MLELKGLPFLEAHPEPWMRNITVGELAGVRTPVVTLHEIEKAFPVVGILTRQDLKACNILNVFPHLAKS